MTEEDKKPEEEKKVAAKDEETVKAEDDHKEDKEKQAHIQLKAEEYNKILSKFKIGPLQRQN